MDEGLATVTVFLVRHGLPLKEPGKTPAEWSLDPAGFDAIWALRESGRLPARADWFSSPETKAKETAQLLTNGGGGIEDELADQSREAQEKKDDSAANVSREIAAHDETTPQ